MAKIVIAGVSDCPYFARVELLADRLVKNLPSFNLHKIIKKPEEWQNWLNSICQERGWKHETSPVVWRELIDRGGKGVLIGGASDFQEYVKGYYGLESEMTSQDMSLVSAENFKTKEEIDKEEEEFRALSKPFHVCITAASSPICYQLIPSLACGEVLGPNTEIYLKLFDVAAEANVSLLQSLQMEVQDLCSGLLLGVEVVSDACVAFKDCSMIIILDELPKQEEESPNDCLKRNVEFFSNYARIINDVAKKGVRVLVAGTGSINLYAYMMILNAPNIPRQNIVALSRVVENSAKAVIASRLNVNTANVVDLIIWGNINGKHFIDLSKARVYNYEGAVHGPPWYSLSAVEMVYDQNWMDEKFLKILQEKKKLAMERRPTVGFAHAITTLISHWWKGSPQGQIFSLGVCSDGWYDIPQGFVFSCPVTFTPKGYWTVVEDLEISDDSTKKIMDSVKDFEKEKEVIFPPSISSFPAIDSGDQLESIKEESLTDILSATELGELKGTSNKQIEQEEVPSDATRENLLGEEKTKEILEIEPKIEETIMADG